MALRPMQSNIIHHIQPDYGMSYGNVDGAMKPVSRIVLGSLVVDVARNCSNRWRDCAPITSIFI
jgi:hypothetical protein